MMQIVKAMQHGCELRPMESAGLFFEDGFYLSNTKNGLFGFSEVLTGDVLSLERKGLIFWHPHKWQYVLTKKGINT